MESEVNTQKEREAFEAVMFKLADGQTKNDINPINGTYLYGVMEVMWQVWQAAKAQTVPEGFVVLKVSDVREIISNASDTMDGESPSTVFIQTGNPSTWYDYHLLAERNILDAIEAQKSIND